MHSLHSETVPFKQAVSASAYNYAVSTLSSAPSTAKTLVELMQKDDECES